MGRTPPGLKRGAANVSAKKCTELFKPVSAAHRKTSLIIEVSVEERPPGYQESKHVHGTKGQLKWPRAAACVYTEAGVFVLPPGVALWIPPGDSHAGSYPNGATEFSLFIRRLECRSLPDHCCATRVSARLADAVEQARQRTGVERPENFPELDRALIGVVGDEFIDIGLRPLPLLLAAGSSLLPVMDLLIRNPAINRPLGEWAAFLAMSESSFRRAFLRDTRMSFSEWRKHARLLHVLCRLADGVEVNQIAKDLDYQPSALIRMFHKELGKTPRQFYRGLLE